MSRTGTKRKGLPGDCQRYCRGRARSGRDCQGTVNATVEDGARSGRDCQGTVNATVEDGHEAEGTARGLSTLLSRTGTKRKRREAETVVCCATALTLYFVFTKTWQDNPAPTGKIIIIVTISNECTH